MENFDRLSLSFRLQEEENNTLPSASFVLAAHVQQPQHAGNRTAAGKKQPSKTSPTARSWAGGWRCGLAGPFLMGEHVTRGHGVQGCVDVCEAAGSSLSHT